MQESPRRTRIPWWRRQYIVNREMQKRYAWSAVIVGVVSSGLSAGMLLWSFWVFHIWQGQRLPNQVIVVILVVLIMNVFGIYAATLLSTSRIAGPLFNLLKQFSRLSRGDFAARASFRRHDEIHYVARRFNEMAESLELRHHGLLKSIDDVIHFAESSSQGPMEQEIVIKLKGLRDQMVIIAPSQGEEE